MRLRRAAVVVALAAGTALAVAGTTNASPENECGEAGTYAETQSWTESDCDFRFARSDSEDPHGDKDHDKDVDHGKDHDKDGDHKDHDKDWDHKDGDKDWDHKDGDHKDHDKDWDHKDKHHHDKHHHDKHHHKKQVHKKPHGGVETGDGSFAAVL